MHPDAIGLGAGCGGRGVQLSGGQQHYLRARTKDYWCLERQREYEYWQRVRIERQLCELGGPAKWDETLDLLLYTLWRLLAGCSGHSVRQDKRVAFLLPIVSGSETRDGGIEEPEAGPTATYWSSRPDFQLRACVPRAPEPSNFVLRWVACFS